MSEFTCPAVCLPTPVYLGTLLGDQHITDKHLTALLNSLAHVCWSTCVSVAVAMVLSFTFNIFKYIVLSRKVKNSVFQHFFKSFLVKGNQMLF